MHYPNEIQHFCYLENDPVVGIEDTKDPIKLQIPNAIISWLASTGFPPAIFSNLKKIREIDF